MPNLELVRKDDLSSFRKIAIGTWRTTYDPSVYGTIELRMDEAMRYLADFRAKTGRKLTISHLMAKATAACFADRVLHHAILNLAEPRFERALEIPGVRLHLYGKRVARPGRKMGHLSALGETSAEATARVIEAWRRVQAP